MNKEEIVKKLETGDYKIEYEEDCECSVEWELDNNNLQYNLHCNRCWSAIYLVMDGERILALDNNNKWYTAGNIEYDDIPPYVRYFMRWSFDGYAREHKYQLLHRSLTEWLMGGKYILSRKDEGYANIYTMVLTRNILNVKVSREEAEQWAADYLKKYDVLPRYYIGLEVR